MRSEIFFIKGAKYSLWRKLNGMDRALMALALSASSLLWGADAIHKKLVDDSLGKSLDIKYDKASKKLSIGPKGGAQSSYTLTQATSAGDIKVSLLSVSGSNFGSQSSLDYSQTANTLTLMSGSKQVVVAINSNNTVTVGGTNCAGIAPGCIADAVIASLPGVDSNAIAAMLVITNEDLHATKNGNHISAALMQIAAQLAHQAIPPPAAPAPEKVIGKAK